MERVRQAAPFVFMMTTEEKTRRYEVLAEECLRANRFEEAVTFLRQLIELHPGEDSYRMGLAWACLDGGRTDEAVECLELIFARELNRRIFTGFAYDELVRIFKDQKKFDRLVDICEQAVAAKPDDVALLSELGDAYLKAGSAKDSVRIFEKITSMEPDSPVFLFSLGLAHIMNMDFADGEAAYRRAAAIDSCGSISVYDRMAQAYLQAGRPEKAETAYRQGLDENGNDPMLLMGLGDVLLQQGKLEEGSAIYERAVALGGRRAGAYLHRLGNMLARAQYHAEAVESYKKAIALDPQTPFYYLALAESYRSLGDPDSAADVLWQLQQISRRE
jgi:tetratricopeptide (TPR) repeat protein